MFLRRKRRPDAARRPAEVPSGPVLALEDVGAMADRLRQAGHEITVVDLVDRVLPAAVRGHASAILAASVDALIRRARSPQHLRLRIRVDGEDLALSMQSTGGASDAAGIRLTADDVAVLRGLVDDASGRMTVRPTATGNWVAVAFLPLHPPA